jgi:small subunit ribosomal protein S9
MSISSGKRKEARAQVFLTKGNGIISINNIPYEKSFLNLPLEKNVILLPLIKLNLRNFYDIKIKVKGGGLNAQLFAIQLAIAKSLASVDENYRILLNKDFFLRSDSRIKERRKYGLKKARKAPQYSKR